VNPAPFTVNVNPGLPAVTVLGEIDVILGVIVKFAEFDVTPPEVMVTGTVFAVVIALAGTEAVAWPLFTTVVVKGAPLKFTTEPAANPLPFTVSVNAAPPATAVAGLIELITGGGLIVNVAGFDVAPPEVTVTETLPGVAIADAGTAAVTWFGLTTVVANCAPLKLTTESPPNPSPFTVSVKPGAPAVAELGLILVMFGATVPE
jgi:hypothetical protein